MPTVFDQRFAANVELTRVAGVELGDPNVPDKHTTACGSRLGEWQVGQRSRYRKGTLAADRIAMLEAIPGWRWALRGPGFDGYLAAFQAFVNEHGHPRVPKPYKTDAGLALGIWLRNQRASATGTTSTPLSQERLDALDAVHTDWRAAYSDQELASRAASPYKRPPAVLDRHLQDDDDFEEHFVLAGIPHLHDCAEFTGDIDSDWLCLQVDLVDRMHPRYASPHGIKRSICVPATWTLQDLTVAICREYGRDELSHWFEFYTPDGRERTAITGGGLGDMHYDIPSFTDGLERLGNLGLQPRDRMMHAFDLGDYWMHRIIVEPMRRDVRPEVERAVADGRAAEPGFYLSYRRDGQAPPQYPEYCSVNGPYVVVESGPGYEVRELLPTTGR